MVAIPDIDIVKSKLEEVSDLEYHKSGGFKVVYKGKVGGKNEAIKLVQIPESPHDPEVKEENLARIKREIDLLSKSTCPFLVNVGNLPVQEIDMNGFTYLVYSEELIDGKDLTELIRNGYQATEKDLKELGICLIECIEDLKSKGAVHRDIKPANVLKTNTVTRPYILIDLGLAFLIDGTDLTRNPRAVPGTDAYLAPEMFEDNFRKRLDYRADLYNAGLTLYEFATRTNPFRSQYNQHSTFLNIRQNNPESLSVLRNDLDKELCDLIDSWLKKIPMLRNSNFASIKKILG